MWAPSALRSRTSQSAHEMYFCASSILGIISDYLPKYKKPIIFYDGDKLWEFLSFCSRASKLFVVLEHCLSPLGDWWWTFRNRVLVPFWRLWCRMKNALYWIFDHLRWGYFAFPKRQAPDPNNWMMRSNVPEEWTDRDEMCSLWNVKWTFYLI